MGDVHMRNELGRNSSVSAVIGLPRARDVTRSYCCGDIPANRAVASCPGIAIADSISPATRSRGNHSIRYPRSELKNQPIMMLPLRHFRGARRLVLAGTLRLSFGRKVFAPDISQINGRLRIRHVQAFHRVGDNL
jgi:hypothetical protein